MSQRYVTDSDRQNFGDETLDMVARQAAETLSPALQRLANENARLDNANRQLHQRITSDAVHRALAAEFGDQWKTINRDMLEWVQGYDLINGTTRHQVLLASYAAGNAPAVIAMFRAYLAEHPGGRAQTSGRAQPRQQTITNRDQAIAALKKLYDDAAHGRYASPEKQKQKETLERQLHAAIHGRR